METEVFLKFLGSNSELYVLSVSLLALVLGTFAVSIRQLRSSSTIDEKILDVISSIDLNNIQNTDEREAIFEALKNLRDKKEGIFSRIITSIEWDVAGIIGIMVTSVILIMILSDKFQSVPTEVFAGWTTILGFYFGRQSRKTV